VKTRLDIFGRSEAAVALVVCLFLKTAFQIGLRLLYFVLAMVDDGWSSIIKCSDVSDWCCSLG
jgi:hypothetical protein